VTYSMHRYARKVSSSEPAEQAELLRRRRCSDSINYGGHGAYAMF
jgi:hypothetical protein